MKSYGTRRDPFCFKPAIAQTYWIRARPLHHGAAWPRGPELEVAGVEPSEYGGWASAHEDTADLPAGSIADHPTGDYSGDGILNLIAYAMDIDPTQPIGAGELVAPLVDDGDLVYNYRHNYTATDVDLLIEISTDMLQWYALSDAENPISFSDAHLHYDEELEYRRLKIQADHDSVFIRLSEVRP